MAAETDQAVLAAMKVEAQERYREALIQRGLDPDEPVEVTKDKIASRVAHLLALQAQGHVIVYDATRPWDSRNDPNGYQMSLPFPAPETVSEA